MEKEKEKYEKDNSERLSHGVFDISSDYNVEMQTNYLLEILQRSLSRVQYYKISFKEANLQSLIPVIKNSSINELMFLDLQCTNEDVTQEEIDLYFTQPLQTICSIHPITKLLVASRKLTFQMSISIAAIITSETSSVKQLELQGDITEIEALLDSFIHPNCKLEELLICDFDSNLTFSQLEKILQTWSLRKLHGSCEEQDIDKIIPLLKRSCLRNIRIGGSHFKKLSYSQFLVKTENFSLWLLLLSVQLRKKRTKGLAMLSNELIRKIIQTLKAPVYSLDI